MFRMKTGDFKNRFPEKTGGESGGGMHTESIRFLLDTDLSFIAEAPLQTHKVQGTGGRPGPRSLCGRPI